MAQTCCVEGCPTVDGDEVTFFPFPVAPRLRRLWVSATRLRRSARCPRPAPLVCSRHFDADRTEVARGKLRLKPQAVPSVFPEGFPTSEKEDPAGKPDTPEPEEKPRRGRSKRTSNQENHNTENKIKKKRRKLTRGRKKNEKSDSSDEESDKSDEGSSKSANNDGTDATSDKYSAESENNGQTGQTGDLVRQETDNSNSTVPNSDNLADRLKKRSKKDEKTEETSEKNESAQEKSEESELMEFRPDVEALFMDKEDCSFDENGAEKCTVECVPEAVLGCEDAEMSETELHKEDIEDIIANYHIQSNKELADRLKAAQEKEDKENSQKSAESTSNKTPGSTSKTSETPKTSRKDSKISKSRKNSDNSQTLETLSSTNEDEEVEFISKEIIETNYIEVPVDQDPNSTEKSQSNDCMMLLEDVQVSIDPATLFPEEGADADNEEEDSIPSPVNLDDDKPTAPISLVTSSDDSDVIIEEPHIDTVEVSDEDEDDIPLVKLVHGDDSDETTTVKGKPKTLSHLLWGKPDYDFYCYHCNFSTSNSAEYNNHKLMKHSSKVLQMCEICMYTTASPSQFTRHKKKHKEEKRFKCHLCDYKAKHNMSLVYHLKSHENVSADTLRLLTLNLKANSVNSVSDSVSAGKCYKKTKKAYRCTRCKFSCKTKQEVLRHQRTCTSSLHVCDKCDYKTKRRSDLRRHKRRRHKDDDDDDDEFVP